MKFKNLNIKQDLKIIIKNKKKKLFLKTYINFMMQEKKFLMDLKVKYF